LNRGCLELVKIPPDGFLTEKSQQKLVRHGHLPEREIMTGKACASPACGSHVAGLTSGPSTRTARSKLALTRKML